VIGDYAVGKTSIIKRYVLDISVLALGQFAPRYTEGFYTPNYKLTIGVDFAVKGAQKITVSAGCCLCFFLAWFSSCVCVVLVSSTRRALFFLVANDCRSNRLG
jgi:hypothetical protein